MGHLCVTAKIPHVKKKIKKSAKFFRFNKKTLLMEKFLFSFHRGEKAYTTNFLLTFYKSVIKVYLYEKRIPR